MDFVLRQALLPALAHSCGTGARVNRLLRNAMRFKSFPYAKFSVRKADPAERASRAATVVYVDNVQDLRLWLETPDGVRFLGQLRDAAGDICWSADPGMVSGAAPAHSFLSVAHMDSPYDDMKLRRYSRVIFLENPRIS